MTLILIFAKKLLFYYYKIKSNNFVNPHFQSLFNLGVHLIAPKHLDLFFDPILVDSILAAHSHFHVLIPNSYPKKYLI